MSEVVLKDSIAVTNAEIAPCEQKIEFKVSADGVSAAFKKAAKEIGRQARVPGFRIGKAPVEMVMKRYAEYVLDEVTKNLQGAGFEKLSGEEYEKLDIVSFGALDAAAKPENGKEYAFAIQVETAPALTIPDYAKFAIEVPEGDSIEKRVSERLTYLKGIYSDFVDVEDAQKADMLKVSYTSDFQTEEGAAASLVRAVKADDAWIWLNEPEQFPGIIAALEGKKVGVEIPVTVAFPADWREAGLQGKTVNYTFKIHQIQRKTAIESDEKLAEKLHVESVEKMKQEIEAGAKKESMYEKMEKARAAALEKLLPCAEGATLPKGLMASTVQREFQHIAEQLVRSEKDVEPFKADREKHMEEAKKAADAYLRKFFVLRQIANLEKISVDESEIDMQIKAMASYMNAKEADIRNMLAKNGGTSEIQADILMNKTLDRVVEAAGFKAE